MSNGPVQLHEDGEWVLNVDCKHIHTYDQTLYSHLVNYPAEVTSLLDSEARLVLAQLFPEQDSSNFEHFVVSSKFYSAAEERRRLSQ